MSQSSSTPVGCAAQYTPDTEHTKQHLDTARTLSVWSLFLFCVSNVGSKMGVALVERVVMEVLVR